jgi:Leucine-rich repeat (LRR) protein
MHCPFCHAKLSAPAVTEAREACCPECREWFTVRPEDLVSAAKETKTSRPAVRFVILGLICLVFLIGLGFYVFSDRDKDAAKRSSGEATAPQIQGVNTERSAISAIKTIRSAIVETTDSYLGEPMLSVRFYDGRSAIDADVDKIIRQLENVASPVALDLSGCEQVTDGALVHANRIQHLQALSLHDTNVTDSGLACLEDLHELRWLRLSERCTDVGLAHLENLKSLEVLIVSSNGITDAGLAHVAQLSKLRKLSVWSKNITEAGYRHLAGLSKLEELHAGEMGFTLGDVALNCIPSLVNLKELDIGGAGLTDSGLAAIKNHSGLKQLHIWADGAKISPAGLRSLGLLPQLEHLTVVRCRAINGEGMAALQGMPALRELVVFLRDLGDSLKPEATSFMQGSGNLRRFRTDGIEDAALQHLGGLSDLADLDLSDSKVSDGGLEHIGKISNLKSLGLAHTAVTDGGLVRISKLRNLESLNLADTHIGDGGVAHLRGLKMLKVLDLHQTVLTDRGLADLANLPDLEVLTLWQTDVSDAGLASLKRLPKLRWIHVGNTKVTAAGRQDLKESFRELAVVGGDR